MILSVASCYVICDCCCKICICVVLVAIAWSCIGAASCVEEAHLMILVKFVIYNYFRS